MSTPFGYGSKLSPKRGPQVLAHVSDYQGKPCRVPIFDPQPFLRLSAPTIGHHFTSPLTMRNDEHIQILVGLNVDQVIV